MLIKSTCIVVSGSVFSHYLFGLSGLYLKPVAFERLDSLTLGVAPGRNPKGEKMKTGRRLVGRRPVKETNMI
jgi:hypothetical protein